MPCRLLRFRADAAAAIDAMPLRRDAVITQLRDTANAKRRLFLLLVDIIFADIFSLLLPPYY
jgi:hypothetical protein